MKHTFQWLLAAVCLFIVGNTQVMASDDEEVKTVLVPISTGNVLTGDDARDGGIVPFAAYCQGGTIYISTSAMPPCAAGVLTRMRQVFMRAPN